MSIYRQSKTFLIIFKNHIFKLFFLLFLGSVAWVVSCVVLLVSERLKMSKSLGIHYWQDITSGVEVNNNVISINKLWRVSTSFVILH